jgi:hypothetical protein
MKIEDIKVGQKVFVEVTVTKIDAETYSDRGLVAIKAGGWSIVVPPTLIHSYIPPEPKQSESVDEFENKIDDGVIRP